MPRVLDFTTAARVKAHLSESGGGAPVGGPDAVWDTYIGTLIRDYSVAFEQHLGRYSLSTTHTEYLDVAPNQQVLALHGFPGITVTSVYNDPDRVWTSGLVDSSNYVVDDAQGHLIFDRWERLVPGYQVLRVIYTGGLSTGTAGIVSTVPDLAHACDIQVAYHFRRHNNLGAAGMGMPNQSINWTGPMDLLPTVRAALSRRMRVAF